MIKLAVPEIGDEEINAAVEVMKSGWLAHGAKNTEFENLFKDFIGSRYAISCSSCTAALFLAIRGLGITGEVIVPSFTWVATANAVITAGATPVFVDIEPASCGITVETIQAAITEKTQAVIPVHYGGQPCDIGSIRDFSEANGLYLIEDSAETIGGTFGGKTAGSFGVGCFSFFPTKNITTGEGGMITTDDPELAATVSTLLGHGIDSTTFQREKSQMPWFRAATIPGYNFRMTNFSAAIGVEQMKKLPEMNASRQRNALVLIDGLKDLEGVSLPIPVSGRTHVYQMFTIQLSERFNRDTFVHAMNVRDVAASVHFFPPVHKQRPYEGIAEYVRSPLPVTETVSERIATLPMSASLSDQELDQIIVATRESLREAVI